jgi:hypothetical protein
MSRRTGVTLEARVAELERTLKLVHAEREHLEAENGRYRAALRQIASAESGAWGWIAHEALHPTELDEGAA